MATTTHTGLPRFDGAALPSDLGQALAEQLDRLVRRLLSRASLPSNDSFAGPSFSQLTPGLSTELRQG